MGKARAWRCWWSGYLAGQNGEGYARIGLNHISRFADCDPTAQRALAEQWSVWDAAGGGHVRGGGGVQGGGVGGSSPLCDIPSGCCFFMGPWTVTRSSLRMLRRVAAFCRPLRPVGPAPPPPPPVVLMATIHSFVFLLHQVVCCDRQCVLSL